MTLDSAFHYLGLAVVISPAMLLAILGTPLLLGFKVRERSTALFKHADDDLGRIRGENGRYRQRKQKEFRNEAANPYSGFKDILKVYYHTGARTSELARVRARDVLQRTCQVVLGRATRFKTVPAVFSKESFGHLAAGRIWRSKKDPLPFLHHLAAPKCSRSKCLTPIFRRISLLLQLQPISHNGSIISLPLRKAATRRPPAGLASGGLSFFN